MKIKARYMQLFQFFSFSILALAGSMLVLSTCRPPKKPEQEQSQAEQKENLIRHQQVIVQDENEEIENFIRIRQYNMTATQTGLRYMIYQEGANDRPVKDDDIVLLTYKVSLLDGTPVYSSETEGDLEMKVGKSEVASGLQEGLKYLHEGDKAIMIIPSHLAYGLTGDGDKIKQYQVLVVDVHVKKIL